METILQVFSSGDIWSYVLKALLTLLLSAATAGISTLIVNLIARNKESRLYKYAMTVVEAAE